jgi:hypothetical protein
VTNDQDSFSLLPEDLGIFFAGRAGETQVIKALSFTLAPGERLIQHQAGRWTPQDGTGEWEVGTR